MIETILIATDGTEPAADAESFAIALAARLPARLQGTVVLEDRYMQPPRDDGLGVSPPPHEPIAAYYKTRAEAVSRRFQERARAAGLTAAGCEVVEGIADDRIVERGQAADLLVLGREGEHAGQRTALIGGTVDGVLRKASKPVIVVPRGARLAGPLLLAFDGSPGSRLAADLAVDLGSRLREPVYVFVDSKDKGRAVARFEEARRRLANIGVVREASSTLGRPDVKIIDAARDAAAGLIIMGAFGRSRITEYFLGSNSAAVVRTSPIAVLLAH